MPIVVLESGLVDSLIIFGFSWPKGSNLCSDVTGLGLKNVCGFVCMSYMCGCMGLVRGCGDTIVLDCYVCGLSIGV